MVVVVVVVFPVVAVFSAASAISAAVIDSSSVLFHHSWAPCSEEDCRRHPRQRGSPSNTNTDRRHPSDETWWIIRGSRGREKVTGRYH